MKKEMIISVLVGLVFGLIIVYGVYTAQSSLNNTDQTTEELGISPSPDSEEENQGNLSLHSPEDESVVEDPQITIAGTTIADSYVVVFVNDEEKITTADETGNFSVEGELELGSNVIEVIAIDGDGQKIKQERTVIYTTKPLVEETSEASDSAATNQEEDVE